jgi:CHAD domain-containing protein
LRQLRRAAGLARDCDVFLLTLQERNRRAKSPPPGADFLVGYILGQRHAAQTRLEEAGTELASKYDQFLTRLLDSTRAPHTGDGLQTLGDLARPLLCELTRALDRAANKDMNNYENLHQVRIAGKGLRYAMEVLVSCFPPVFKDTLLPAVEEMQEILGQANDSRVASQRLGALREHLQSTRPADWHRWAPAFRGLLSLHQRRLPRQRRRFIEWWQRWQERSDRATLNALLQPP